MCYWLLKVYFRRFPETSKTPGREAGRSKGGTNQRVGDKQATWAWTTKSAASRTEWSLQSAVGAVEKPYCYLRG